jgi:hypothetical protein
MQDWVDRVEEKLGSIEEIREATTEMKEPTVEERLMMTFLAGEIRKAGEVARIVYEAMTVEGGISHEAAMEALGVIFFSWAKPSLDD